MTPATQAPESTVRTAPERVQAVSGPAQSWARGDYQKIAFEHVVVSENLCAEIGISSAQSVLDVACGTGNTALAAARRRAASVTGLDIVPHLLETARRRAAAEGFDAIDFQEGDAAALPFPDAAFDVVLSTFGVSFVPDQPKVARELMRVTKPGGTIGITVYSAQSIPSDVYRLGATMKAPPKDIVPAFEWAKGPRVQELLGSGCADIRLSHHSVDACFPSTEAFFANNSRYHGPIGTRLAGFTPEQQERFRDGMLEILEQHNRAADGTLMAVFDYVTILGAPDGCTDHPGGRPVTATRSFDPGTLLMRKCLEDAGNVLGYGHPPAPPPDYADIVQDGMRILRNCTVPMRDGIEIFADVYLPEGAGVGAQLGVIVGWAAFGKHNTSASLPSNTGLPEGSISEHTGFEVPDPAYWTRAGYAIVYPDPRGSWHSPGDYHQGGIEIDDAYDLCEWAGEQPWSNGKVAFTGVSYPATIAWQLAAKRPPHLAAIMPWEGFTDMYREFAYHGGMRETGHTRMVSKSMGWPGRSTEDLGGNYDAHPFDDEFWGYKNADIAAIEVPTYVCASWSDQGLHGRGTIAGWTGIASQHKWLQIHGRQKWAEYYKPENIERQRMFFDRFLLGKDTGIDERPPVEYEVRESAFVGRIETADSWPPAGTTYTSLYLDADRRMLAAVPPATGSSARYRPTDRARLTFDHTFDRDTEIIGTASLNLWVEADGSDDMDLFVALQKLDAQGNEVGFPFFAFHTDGPVALGWLRASHRELDAARSTPGRPVHLHQREQRLHPGEVVPVEIEIWPSGTLFRTGETLRVLIQGQDIYVYEEEHTQGSHLELRNAGEHVVHTGGRYDSRLVLPVVPR